MNTICQGCPNKWDYKKMNKCCRKQNKITIKAMKEAEKGIGLTTYKNVDEMFKVLEI